MKDKSLLDFRDEWKKLVQKGMSNYNSLTRDERIWFNIEALIGMVDNGGIIGHYCNYGAERNKETIEDLITLGFQDIADLLIRVNRLFPNEEPPYDIGKRNEIIAGWEDDEIDDLFERLDRHFYEREEDLEKALVKHIQGKLLSQFL